VVIRAPNAVVELPVEQNEVAVQKLGWNDQDVTVISIPEDGSADLSFGVRVLL
jgi:hypothetical protein